MLYIILTILGILAIIAELSMMIAWILPNFLYKENKKLTFNPKTCIIVPCKGLETNFTNNIKALLNQKYKNYKIIFVVDSIKDPAYNKLNELIKNNPKANIEISTLIKGASGKTSALISGVKAAGNSEVFVFADSDIAPHKDWLQFLVSNLDGEKIGATTGYRWYFSQDFKSLLLSTWNMASIAAFFYPKFNFTWGGSTAIKKSVFEKLDIENKWKKGFSDDLILTKALRENKYIIKFVPKCIIKSPIEGGIIPSIKWGTRQFTWVRWYLPSNWILSFTGSIGLKIITVLGIVLLLFGFTTPGLIMISTILFEIATGLIGHLTLKKFMNYSKEELGSSIYYGLLTPIIYFILAYNNLLSLFTSEIKWGGRSYKKPGKLL